MANFPLDLRIKFEKYVKNYQQNQLGPIDGSLLETKSIPSASTLTPSNSSIMNLLENAFDFGPILTKSTQGPMIVDYYYIVSYFTC
jgi:hypothetical protein